MKLKAATIETNKMLASLEISSAEAMKESKLVQGIKDKCESIARISGEKTNVADLAKVQPYVDQANSALILLSQVTLGRLRC